LLIYGESILDSRDQKIAEAVIDLDSIKYDVGAFIVGNRAQEQLPWLFLRFEALRDKIKKLKETEAC
jgi:hypothetical protein